MKSYTKKAIICIVLFLSIFIGYKSYIFLDFTLGNTLQWMYNSYVFSEKSVNTVVNTTTKIKNVITFNSEDNTELNKEIANNKNIRDEEIAWTKKLIDLIPILLAIIISWKIFSFIMNLIINENSVILKTQKWIKWE